MGAEARGAGRRRLQRVFSSAQEFVLYAEGIFNRMSKGELTKGDQESGRIGKRHYGSQGRVSNRGLRLWSVVSNAPTRSNTMTINMKVIILFSLVSPSDS